MNGCIYRTVDNQCRLFTDPTRNTLSWCVGDNPCEARKLSNGDRIRNMSDEELAEFANAEGLSPWCGMHKKCPQLENDPADCRPCMLEWLKKEVEE